MLFSSSTVVRVQRAFLKSIYHLHCNIQLTIAGGFNALQSVREDWCMPLRGRRKQLDCADHEGDQ